MSHVCIPVYKAEGINSKVSPYFGCAREYLILDTKTRAVRSLDGLNSVRSCQKTFELIKDKVDEVWCRYLRHGAALIMNSSGITIRRAEKGQTVSELLEKWADKKLPEVTEDMMCQGTNCQKPQTTVKTRRCCSE